MDLSILNGETCLVTGAAGFIGAHICAQLSSVGAAVIAVDCEPFEDTAYPLFNDDTAKLVTLDLGASHCIERLCDLDGRYIFHLAARAYTPWTTGHPVETYYSNTLSTVHVGIPLKVIIDSERSAITIPG